MGEKSVQEDLEEKEEIAHQRYKEKNPNSKKFFFTTQINSKKLNKMSQLAEACLPQRKGSKLKELAHH